MSSPVVRFFASVKKSTGCWIWTGLRNKKGYGSIAVWLGPSKRAMVLAHRWSWEHHVGKIPEGSCVLHRCDVPSCVRPEHLFLGSRTDNNKDMSDKGRRRSASGDANGRRKHPDNWPKGEAITGSKLSEEEVRRVRAEYVDGSTSFVKLGKKYGVGRTTVENIVKGRKWKHVR